jgi:WD40 repeat protein
MDYNHIDDLVCDKFPYPVALCYRHLTEAETPTPRFGCLLDVYESLLHYLATVLISQYWRDGVFAAQYNEELLKKFYKGAWSTGDLLWVVRETTRLYLDKPDRLPYPQLVSYLFKPNGKPTSSLQTLESFVELRNKYWGHAGGRDDDAYNPLIDKHLPRLQKELGLCQWLAQRALWLPTIIDETSDPPRVLKADILMSDRRRRGREVQLALQANDLDINGGDIIPERTLLLVDEPSGNYLPLFPLSLFHVRQFSAGTFFLNKLTWQSRQELQRTTYLSYDPELDNYEARSPEPPVTRLQAHIRQLKRWLEQQGSDVQSLEEDIQPASPDYDIPEVWVEQEFHLKTFVGRDKWLTRLKQQLQQHPDGGYYLLLGVPGQGKSALMAQLAYELGACREGQPSGGNVCLLHMVKSHRHPVRFIRSLLWQLERVLGKPLSSQTYQGDIDDLRNALVKELEKVCQRKTRVVLIIDALDELDLAAEHIDFLPEQLPAGAYTFLTCRPDIPLVNALKTRFRNLTIETLTPLEPDELQLFIEKHAGSNLLQQLQIERPLLQRTGGNPLLLRYAVDAVLREVKHAQEHGHPMPRIDLSRFPETVEALFHSVYNGIRAKRDSDSRRELGRQRALLAQLLAIAFEPLSIEQMRDLLRIRTNSPVSLEDTRDLLIPMSEYLLHFEGERFLLYHHCFADFLRHRVLGCEDEARLHHTFAVWLQTPRQRKRVYRLRYLVRHLLHCTTLAEEAGLDELAEDARSQIHTLLTDFTFVGLKVQAGLVPELRHEYQQALHYFPDDAKLALWYRFIDTEGHVLMRFPHLYLQQAANQTDNTVVSQAAARYLKSSSNDVHTTEHLLRLVHTTPEAFRPEALRIIIGHEDWVRTVVTLPDGRIASGSKDGTVRIWETETGRCLTILQGHKGSVRALAVLRDNKLASGSEDATIRVWDTEQAKCVQVIDELSSVLALAALPNGRLASAGWDGVIRIWDVEQGKCLQTLQGHPSRVLALAVLPGGRLASGGDDRVVRIWDVGSGTRLQQMEGHTGGIRTLGVLPDSRLVSGSEDGTIRVWDLEQGCIKVMRGDEYSVFALAVLPNGNVVAAGRDRVIRVWDITAEQCLASLKGHTYWIFGVAVLPQGKLVSVGRDRTIRIWSLEQQALREAEGHTRRVSAMTMLSHSELVSGSEDGTICMWDIETGKCLKVLKDDGIAVRSLVALADGRMATGGDDGTVRVWDIEHSKQLWHVSAHEGWVNALCLLPDGRIASGGDDGTVCIWDLGAGKCVKVLRGHRDWVLALVALPDGRLASAGRDRSIRIWNTQLGECEKALEGHDHRVQALALLPDNRLVSAGRDRTIRAWDIYSGKCLAVLRGHTHWVVALAITPDGKIVSGSNDGTLKVWDLGLREPIATFPAKADVSSCAVTQNGLIACGDGTGAVYFLQLEPTRDAQILS